MKLSHFQLCQYSIFYPNRLAAFRLLTIGKTMQYLFIFITIITLSSFIHFTISLNNGSTTLQSAIQYIEAMNMTWILYPFAFMLLFISTTLLIMAQVSIYAAVGYVVGRVFGYRVEYRHMWRTAAFAATINYFLQAASPYFATHIDLILQGGAICITVGYVAFATTKYPKQKKAAAKQSVQ